MYIKKERIIALFAAILLLSIMFSDSALSADIEGFVDSGIKAAIFDGTDLKAVEISGSRFKAMHGVTPGYYGILYFIKTGYHPKSILFKSLDRPDIIDKISLEPLRGLNKGILTGVIYKPITGGKITAHTGIISTGRDKKITIVKGSFSRSVSTDSNGIFMAELLAGEYDIIFKNKKVAAAVIESGKTTIKNIQEGMALID